MTLRMAMEFEGKFTLKALNPMTLAQLCHAGAGDRLCSLTYVMDALDSEAERGFDGKVVRKDLLHRIKKGTNVPTFVLEFLLARYCASDDPAEIQAGHGGRARHPAGELRPPRRGNAAQSRVAMKGKHKFIDKVHVRYVEKEKRHWAVAGELQLAAHRHRRKVLPRQRPAAGGRHLGRGRRIAHNDIDDDDYAFYVEDLRPIQLSRFDFEPTARAGKRSRRDEWMDVVLRSVGLEPSKLSNG